MILTVTFMLESWTANWFSDSAHCCLNIVWLLHTLKDQTAVCITSRDIIPTQLFLLLFFFLSIFHLNVSCLSGCCFCLSFYNFGRSMSSFETETHVWVFFWIGLSVFSLEVSVKGQHEDLSRQQELAWLKTACEELALPGGVTLETGHSTAHSAPDNTASATRKQHPYGRVNDQETTPVWRSQRPGNNTRMVESTTRNQHLYGWVSDQETTPACLSQRPGNNTRMAESTTRKQHLFGLVSEQKSVQQTIWEEYFLQTGRALHSYISITKSTVLQFR